MRTTDMLQNLVMTAKEAEVDLRKFENGNTSAGIRARWKMQEVRQKAKSIRAEVQRIRKKRKAAKRAEDDSD